MAGKRTPLKNNAAAVEDDLGDDAVTETSFGSDDDDEDEEMTDAQRRRARGDGVPGDDDDDDADSEEDDGEEEDEEESEEEDEEGEDDEEEEDEEEEEEGDEEEEEGEEEGDDEEDVDADALAAIAGGGKQKAVPYGRFAEVIAQNKQLIEILVGQRGGAAAPKVDEQPEPPPFDFKAKGKEYRDAVLDGDDAKAEALEAEIDAAKAARIKADVLQETQREFDRRQAQAEQVQVQAVIGKIQKDYPIFNDAAGEDFDQEALDELLGLRDTYIRKGMSVPEALRKAADRIAVLHGYEAAKPAGKVVKGKGGVKSGKKPSKEGQENRSVRELRRALDNKRRTPAPLHRAGTGNRAVPRTPVYGENGPSEGQIRKMSEREKAEARGDFVSRKSRDRK